MYVTTLGILAFLLLASCFNAQETTSAIETSESPSTIEDDASITTPTPVETSTAETERGTSDKKTTAANRESKATSEAESDLATTKMAATPTMSPASTQISFSITSKEPTVSVAATEPTDETLTKSTDKDKMDSTDTNTTQSDVITNTATTNPNPSMTTKSIDKTTTNFVETSTTNPSDSNTTQSNVTTITSTTEPITTKATEITTTKPTEKTTTKPTEVTTTKATEVTTTKPTEVTTTKPTEVTTTKPTEKTTTKPTEKTTTAQSTPTRTTTEKIASTTSAPTTTSLPPTTTPYIKTVRSCSATFDEQYTSDLADPTSNAYQSRSQQFEKQMTPSIKQATGDSNARCVVTGFRKGSIIVDFRVFVSPDVKLLSALKEAFEQAGLKVTNVGVKNESSDPTASLPTKPSTKEMRIEVEFEATGLRSSGATKLEKETVSSWIAFGLTAVFKENVFSLWIKDISPDKGSVLFVINLRFRLGEQFTQDRMKQFGSLALRMTPFFTSTTKIKVKSLIIHSATSDDEPGLLVYVLAGVSALLFLICLIFIVLLIRSCRKDKRIAANEEDGIFSRIPMRAKPSVLHEEASAADTAVSRMMRDSRYV